MLQASTLICTSGFRTIIFKLPNQLLGFRTISSGTTAAAVKL
jgi:hypothetical protein